MIKITYFTTIICMFFTVALSAQSFCDCAPEDDPADRRWYDVSAPSGLILRSAPSRTASKLDAIPFGEQVLGCHTTDVEETIEGKKSRWIKVSWAEKSGYLFGGFLTETKVPNIRMVIPNAGVDSQWGCMEFPSATAWQGLVNADTSKKAQSVEYPSDLVAVDLRMGRKEVDLDCHSSGVVGNTVLNEIPVPFAVFSGFKLAKNVRNLVSAPVKLLPGTVETFRFYDQATQTTRNYIITAEGNVISNPRFVTDKNGWEGPIDRIEQYRVNLYEQKFQINEASQNTPWKVQKLEDGTATKPNDSDTYQMGVLYIYFAGDLDGDQQLDLILARLDGVGSTYSLHLSSKKTAVFFAACCGILE